MPQPPSPSGRRWVRVWDLPTRLFHWALVAAVVIAGATGFFGPVWMLSIHTTAGYVIAGLIVFRLVWGVAGGELSRFSALVRAVRHLPRHIGALARLQPTHYLGHNPAGSAMILALLLVLAGLVATGLLVEGGAEKQGLLAGVTSYALGSAVKEIHELLAYAIAAMVAAHIGGVALETVLLRLPLVPGMITGRLPLPEAVAPATDPAPARYRLALPLLAVIGATAIGLLTPLWQMPALGVPSEPLDTAYAAECGDCHEAFHPSLLPRATWAGMMAGLSDHFGEDASLPQATAEKLAAYLDANASETWDTRPANRFRLLDAAEPLRITATPYWRRRHRELPEAVFKSPMVKSRGHCSACHRDAASGLFAAQAIDVPDSNGG